MAIRALYLGYRSSCDWTCRTTRRAAAYGAGATPHEATCHAACQRPAHAPAQRRWHTAAFAASDARKLHGEDWASDGADWAREARDREGWAVEVGCGKGSLQALCVWSSRGIQPKLGWILHVPRLQLNRVPPDTYCVVAHLGELRMCTWMCTYGRSLFRGQASIWSVIHAVRHVHTSVTVFV